MPVAPSTGVEAEDVVLGDAAVRAGAGDGGEVDALGGGDARGDGGGLDVASATAAAAAPLGERSDLAVARCALRRSAGGSAGAELHPRDDLPNDNRRALLGEQLGDGAGRGGGQLHVDLVGGDLDDRVAVVDGVADLDRPLQDGALGDRLAAGGRRDVDDLARRVDRSLRGRTTPVAVAAVGRCPPSPAPAAISASTEPTCTVSPSAKWIATMVPLAGAGTSASTLSVETSTRISSASMVSPTCLCHSRMVPSVTDSPMAGKVT